MRSETSVAETSKKCLHPVVKRSGAFPDGASLSGRKPLLSQPYIDLFQSSQWSPWLCRTDRGDDDCSACNPVDTG